MYQQLATKRALISSLAHGLPGHPLSILSLQQSSHTATIKTAKNVRFAEDLTIRFNILGKEETHFEKTQVRKERNDLSLSFATYLMINALGIDISHKELF